MPTSANYLKNPNDVRADVGIRAPILPLSHQPLTNGAMAIIPRLTRDRSERQNNDLDPLLRHWKCGYIGHTRSMARGWLATLD